MMFWIIVTAVALVLSAIGVVLLGSVPSSERASNGDVLLVVAICFGVVFTIGFVIKGVMSLFGAM